jgi:hypothetical protein
LKFSGGLALTSVKHSKADVYFGCPASCPVFGDYKAFGEPSNVVEPQSGVEERQSDGSAIP